MNTASIQITDTAGAHIRNQLRLTQARFLRLGVKESGCNGYMYTLDFLETPEESDACFDFGDGVMVCVRNRDLPMVQGTEVDLITEGLNSALVFKNSKATSYCGCGESFAVGGSGLTGGDEAGAGVDVADLAKDVGSA